MHNLPHLYDDLINTMSKKGGVLNKKIQIGDEVVQLHTSPRCGSRSSHKQLLAAAGIDPNETILTYGKNPSDTPDEHWQKSIERGLSRSADVENHNSEYRQKLDDWNAGVHYTDAEPTIRIAIVRDPIDRFKSAYYSIVNTIMRHFSVVNDAQKYQILRDRGANFSIDEVQKQFIEHEVSVLQEMFTLDNILTFTPMTKLNLLERGLHNEDYEILSGTANQVYTHYIMMVLSKQTHFLGEDSTIFDHIFTTSEIDTTYRSLLSNISGIDISSQQENQTSENTLELTAEQENLIRNYYAEDYTVFSL